MVRLFQKHFFRYLLTACLLIFVGLSVKTYNSRTGSVRIALTSIEQVSNRMQTTVINASLPLNELSTMKSRENKIIHEGSFKDLHQMTLNMTKQLVKDSKETISIVKDMNFNTSKSNIKKIIHKPTMIKNKDVNPEVIKHVQLPKQESRDDLVNLHAYSYTISPRVCDSRQPFLVILVHSAPDYYKKRTLIRSTFGSVKQYKGRNITLVFLIGAVETKPLQEALNEEAELYGDIVQGKFVDSYRALLKKHIMGMHWYFSHCKSDYILKIDDDTFLNPYRLMDFLIEKKPNNGVWCYPATGFKPFRDQKSKYYTPESQYPFKIFPQFCLGFGYITTPDMWTKLYRESETTRMMNMDDVYVGILALKSGVKIVDIKDLLYNCKRKTQNLSELKHKAFFFDPMAQCGNKPFIYWRHLVESTT